MSRPPIVGLSPAEKKFVAALRKLHRAKAPTTYRAIGNLAGWVSVEQAWQYAAKLIRKGYLKRTKVLTLVDSFVLTPKGRRAA